MINQVSYENSPKQAIGTQQTLIPLLSDNAKSTNPELATIESLSNTSEQLHEPKQDKENKATPNENTRAEKRPKQSDCNVSSEQNPDIAEQLKAASQTSQHKEQELTCTFDSVGDAKVSMKASFCIIN
jgi:hypothetical protein